MKCTFRKTVACIDWVLDHLTVVVSTIIFAAGAVFGFAIGRWL